MKKPIAVLLMAAWGQAAVAFAGSAAPSVSVAQAEFAKYCRAVTGKALPQDAVKFVIDPAVSKSGRDAYSIVSSGEGAQITGSNLRSVLYGVYDLLERRAGDKLTLQAGASSACLG